MGVTESVKRPKEQNLMFPTVRGNTTQDHRINPCIRSSKVNSNSASSVMIVIQLSKHM